MKPRMLAIRLAIAAPLAWPQWLDAQITSAKEVRALSAEAAEMEQAVKLEATVIFVDLPATVFVQQDGAGTFLRFIQVPQAIKPGDVVLAEGFTFPGLFVPGIKVSKWQVLRHSEMPPAVPATPDDLQSGRFHYQLVSIEGVVRSVLPLDEDKSVVRLAVGSRIIEVRVDEQPLDLTDHVVRVTGLAAGNINNVRQLVNPYVRVARWSEIATVSPARPLESLQPLKPSDLLKFDADGNTAERRVRVEGMVSAIFGDKSLLFLQDSEGSIAVAMPVGAQAKIGDVIRVPGFATMDRFTPTLADTGPIEVTQHGTEELAPWPVAMSSMSKTVRDGGLVTLTGRVVDTYRSDLGESIQLEQDGVRVIAIAPRGLQTEIAPGQQVSLTGIARVQSVVGKGYNALPDAFHLWLRSQNDVRVISEPSPWTTGMLLKILGIAAVMGMGGLVWIYLLKRQVTRLQDRVRHEAVLEERQRIAREFHDTLEQELAGLSLRLDAATSRPLDDKAHALLTTSRNLITRVQVEARNLVADLRQDLDQPLNLEDALIELSHQHVPPAPILKVETTGTSHTLPQHVVHHLRMIAQEAVTNILKHAHASNVMLRLHGTPGTVILEVEDDGIGFSTIDGNPPSASGHFGCVGIRERCQRIGAKVTWRSQPGKGTTLQVTLPT
ncbi:MAG: ATP-binding protein [Verrucomicrobiaceae bacterium]|nr:ATP-binding protein [Verrucomicrobiaceae bacterium]